MLGLTVRAAKRNFFDRTKVKNAMDRATHRVLSRFGAYVRTTAMRSIRYRKMPSSPGKPPHGHRGMLRIARNRKTGQQKARLVSPLREFIFFAYDQAKKKVVIGPALLNGRGGAMTLRALEYGGPAVIREPATGKSKLVRIRARPFMRPALQEELPELRKMVRNMVR